MGRPQQAGRDALLDGARPVAPTHHAPRRAFARLLRSTAGPVWSTITAVGVALLAALTALRWVDSPIPDWIPGLQAVVPVALPVAVVVLLLTAWRGPRAVAVAAGAVTAVHVILVAPWWIPGGQTARTGDDPLVVLSSNVQFGFSFPDIQALVAEVRDRDADVLVLIEAAPGTEGVARDAGIDRDLPHAVGVPRTDAGGAFIFSRYPLTTDGVPRPPDTRYDQPTAVVQAPQGDVLVMAAHVVAPLDADAEVWHRELTALSSWVAAAPTDRPMVVAGDFNAGSDHPAFRRVLAAGMHDAQRELGRGRRRTWPDRALPFVPPFVDLDHVLIRGLDVAAFDTFAVPGTDHYAVSAALVPGDG